MRHLSIDVNTGEETITGEEVILTEEDILNSNKAMQREKRNILLALDVDPKVTNILLWDSFSSEKKAEWINYRQALLDVPEQSGFPNDITLPTKPE